MELCECKSWARDSIVLLTEHHPNCEKYDVEKEAKNHIKALLKGMMIWAADEDGIHDQCYDAFKAAAWFIGKQNWFKDKPTICLDFDGVIHSYTSGWQGVISIPDPPVPGAVKFIREAVEHFKVCVFSSRSAQYGGRSAMEKWMKKHGFPEGVEFPANKPPAILTIDDRGFCFQGTFPTIEWIKNFKPWNR